LTEPRASAYWRTLKSQGELNPKYPGGIAMLKRKLGAENHRVVRRGKRYFVPDYEKSLFDFERVKVRIQNLLLVLALALPGCFLAGCETLSPPPAAASGIKPTLFLAGDSTVHTMGPRTGWGDVIVPFFDASRITVTNWARGGRSSRTFQTEGLWEKMLAQTRPGDFVLIQFGHNDGGPLDDTNRARGTLRGLGDESREIYNPIQQRQEVVHTYGWYLRKYIADARAKDLTPVLCSPVPRMPSWPSKPMDVDRYAAWSRLVAQSEKVPMVDLNRIIKRHYAGLTTNEIKTIFFTPLDNTHTSVAGAQLNAGCVVEGLCALRDCRLKEYLAPDSMALSFHR
jgi:lysophospholipase L1-like esterase